MTEAEAGLTISLLGPLSVRLAGRPLPRLRSRKGYELLALLALRHDRELLRTWLADLLWPDSLADEGLTSLRQSLSDLRKALGEESARLQSPSTRTLRLDLAGADVDLLAFDRAAAAGDTPSLERAVSLYRGPLLEGWSEVWVLPEREARRQAYLRALEALAERAAADGADSRAVHYLRLASEADPLRQSLHRALMQLHARRGEYDAALQVYQDLRRRLHAGFNAAPDPDTTALYRQLRGRARREHGAAASALESRNLQERSRAREGPGAAVGSGPQGSLPRSLTRLIGRERDLQAILGRLLTARLVTLTGPGGIGKTRLALEAAWECAEEYGDGAFFVDLTGLQDPASVPQAAATTLGILDETAGSPAEALARYLRPRQLLLVLDNCEHLIDACAALADTLLRECAGLRILATSRERLGITGEVLWQVLPLSLPPEDAAAPDALEAAAAVRLFVQRAAAVRPGFDITAENSEAVTRICRQLDGIPLALELSAAMVEAFSPGEIASGLGDQFRLLGGEDRTRPERHRSLAAVFDWSYRRLIGPEQALFRSLSVFTGGWTLAAARFLPRPRQQPAAVLQAVSGLVAKSLVLPEERHGETRYRMLETIRQYGLERLREAGETDTARDRQLEYCLRLAEEAEPALTGPEQVEWLRRLDAERDNLRAALDWAFTRSGEVVPTGEATSPEGAGGAAGRGLRLAAALGRYWQIRGEFREGAERLRRFLALGADRSRGRARALSWAGFLELYQGEYGAARGLCGEALELWRELGDRKGVAGTLGCLAIIEKDTGHPERARDLFEQSLAIWREAGDPVGVAGTLGYLGILARTRGDYPTARAYYEESLALRRRCGDRWGVAASLNNLGLLEMSVGDLGEARACLAASLAIRRELGDRRCLAVSLNNLGIIACREGDLSEARRCFEESLRLCRETGDRRSTAYSLEAFTLLAALEREWAHAARLSAAADALREAIGAPLPETERADLARVMADARSILGEDRFQAARSEGRDLALEEAIRLAPGEYPK